MFQICIMSGHEGIIRPEKMFYLTLMGGCDLTRPTIARQILARKEQQRQGMIEPPRQFFFTLMGGVQINSPTLAEEFLDLRELVRGGAMSMSEWDAALADISRFEISVASFTLMGGFDDGQLPAEAKEIDSLALQFHLGNIPEPSLRVLQMGIGQKDAERRSTVRRALAHA